MNTRANSEIYDQRRKKLKRRNKRYFQRIMIALIAFYSIFFTSNIWLRSDYSNIDITPIGNVVTGNNREVTLISWNYCSDDKKMEILLGISNTSYDGNDTYTWTAEDRATGSLTVNPIIQTRNFVVLQLVNLPSRISVISLRMDNPDIKEFETLRIYGDPKRNITSVSSIQEKTENEYHMALLRRNGQDYHMYDFLSLAGTGKYASVLHHYQEKEYGEIIIGTNNDSGGQESNKAIHKLCQNLPVKLIDQYPEQNDWNDKLKYVIGHGYRSNYIAESKDITDALEARLDAMMMSDQDSLKSECMNFSSKMLHETNLLPNNMDPYIQNYIQYIQKTYPGKSFKEVLAAEKGHDRIPGKQILHNYNRKQFFRVDLTQESALSL